MHRSRITSRAARLIPLAAALFVAPTAYGHLKTGSPRVSEGDAVERGQVIAEVGDTGDSAAVHLHFQVMEGGQPMRSIPYRFDGVRILSNELGSWIEPSPDGH